MGLGINSLISGVLSNQISHMKREFSGWPFLGKDVKQLHNGTCTETAQFLF